MRPRCYNRPPAAAEYEANAGRGHLIGPGGITYTVQLTKKIPVVFVDRCATWDGRGIGPNGEPYPLAHGWDCSGCVWLPESASLLTDTSTSETP